MTEPVSKIEWPGNDGSPFVFREHRTNDLRKVIAGVADLFRNANLSLPMNIVLGSRRDAEGLVQSLGYPPGTVGRSMSGGITVEGILVMWPPMPAAPFIDPGVA